MNDVRRFLALAARTLDFLARQDDATLEAYARGERELTLLPAGGAPADLPARDETRAAAPPRTPHRAARTLPTLTSQHERRHYLDEMKFSVKELREVAKLRGLSRYSRLTRAELVELLVDDAGARVAADPVEPNPVREQRAAAQDSRPSVPVSSSDTARSEIDAAAIAGCLRETDTEDEGATYLDAQRLDRAGLLAVAAELRLTRVERLSQKELRRRVLKQAIGARRKFAGLRKW